MKILKKYHEPFISEAYYHIFNRSINKEKLFLNENNYGYFLNQWNKYIDPYLSVLSYCLLPNHYHFFVQVRATEVDNINGLLEEKFKRFLSSYTLAYNKQNKRTGSLFQKSFKRIEVREDYHFTKLLHYIHHNPVHHGLVKHYSNWKFSSFTAVISNKPTQIDRKMVLEWFGGKENFIEFHSENLNYNKIERLIKHDI